MLSISKTWPMSILEVDNKRPHKELSDDMLLDEPYGAFCRGALQGQIRVLGGGPNCRTWWFPKPGAPVPVRDRSPANTWGFPELTHQDQVDTDNDSLLLLRFLVILTLAHEGAKAYGASPPASFLEHPKIQRNAQTRLRHTDARVSGLLDGSETFCRHLVSASFTSM